MIAASRSGSPPVELWVDTGGTFTDCVLRRADGELERLKVLSSSALRGRLLAVEEGRVAVDLAAQVPEGFFEGYGFHRLGTGGRNRVVRHVGEWLELDPGSGEGWQPGEGCDLASPEAAPVLAARWALGLPMARALPPLRVRLATTRATNALLERRGVPPVLFVTRGFADLLAIGDQRRPELFALEIRRPEPLYSEVVEVAARRDAEGRELEPLDLGALDRELDRLRLAGRDSAAVALLHAYLDPSDERRLAEHLRARGFLTVSCSAELAPLIGYLARAETAVVDAYLTPVLAEYLSGVQRGLAPRSLQLMTSAGGLMRHEDFRARDALLSGPAGGVVGAALAGRRSGLSRLIAFDMGGTSTDVARWAGDLEYVYEQRVGDARLVAPAVAIETVAAGGGSICRAEDGLPKVGPESAGATPGPACYGEGGPLTLTDVNLLLGRLDPGRFGIPLDPLASRGRLSELVAELGAPEEELLAGFSRIADERMAEAIRRISVRRGYDPSDHALVAFGGAGGQHACSVASLLGIGTVLSPAEAGVLSALGLGHAPVERIAQRQLLQGWSEASPRVPSIAAALAEEALGALLAEGFERGELELRRSLASVRLVGQDSALEIELGDDPLQAFGDAYEAVYGYPPPPGREVEVVSLRAIVSTRPAPLARASSGVSRELSPARDRRVWMAGRWREAAALERESLGPGESFAGPALVFDDHTTLVVEPGWRGRVDGSGAVVLERG